MDADQLWEVLNQLSITCGMNQRYFQFLVGNTEWWSTAIDIAVVITTMLGMAFTVAAYWAPEGTIWRRWRKWSLADISLFSTVSAAIAGIVLLVHPYTAPVQEYGSLYQAWSDLRQDVDSAITDWRNARDNQTELDYLLRRYRDLAAKKNALNSREHQYADQDLLARFLEEEEIARGLAPFSPKKTSATNWRMLSILAVISVLVGVAATLCALRLRGRWNRPSAPAPAIG